MFVVTFFLFCQISPTTQIYTLSLHDALPISPAERAMVADGEAVGFVAHALEEVQRRRLATKPTASRSEEHTSELQSLRHLVCRLLLEKKKTTSAGHRQEITE